jgi:hypothetical protein
VRDAAEDHQTTNLTPAMLHDCLAHAQRGLDAAAVEALVRRVFGSSWRSQPHRMAQPLGTVIRAIRRGSLQPALRPGASTAAGAVGRIAAVGRFRGRLLAALKGRVQGGGSTTSTNGGGGGAFGDVDGDGGSSTDGAAAVGWRSRGTSDALTTAAAAAAAAASTTADAAAVATRTSGEPLIAGSGNRLRRASVDVVKNAVAALLQAAEPSRSGSSPTGGGSGGRGGGGGGSSSGGNAGNGGHGSHGSSSSSSTSKSHDAHHPCDTTSMCTEREAAACVAVDAAGKHEQQSPGREAAVQLVPFVPLVQPAPHPASTTAAHDAAVCHTTATTTCSITCAGTANNQETASTEVTQSVTQSVTLVSAHISTSLPSGQSLQAHPAAAPVLPPAAAVPLPAVSHAIGAHASISVAVLCALEAVRQSWLLEEAQKLTTAAPAGRAATDGGGNSGGHNLRCSGGGATGGADSTATAPSAAVSAPGALTGGSNAGRSSSDSSKDGVRSHPAAAGFFVPFEPEGTATAKSRLGQGPAAGVIPKPLNPAGGLRLQGGYEGCQSTVAAAASAAVAYGIGSSPGKSFCLPPVPALQLTELEQPSVCRVMSHRSSNGSGGGGSSSRRRSGPGSQCSGGGGSSSRGVTAWATAPAQQPTAAGSSSSTNAPSGSKLVVGILKQHDSAGGGKRVQMHVENDSANDSAAATGSFGATATPHQQQLVASCVSPRGGAASPRARAGAVPRTHAEVMLVLQTPLVAPLSITDADELLCNGSDSAGCNTDPSGTATALHDQDVCYTPQAPEEGGRLNALRMRHVSKGRSLRRLEQAMLLVAAHEAAGGDDCGAE